MSLGRGLSITPSRATRRSPASQASSIELVRVPDAARGVAAAAAGDGARVVDQAHLERHQAVDRARVLEAQVHHAPGGRAGRRHAASRSPGSGSSWIRLQASTWSKSRADALLPAGLLEPGADESRAGQRRARGRGRGRPSERSTAVTRAPLAGELGGHQAGRAPQLQHGLARRSRGARCARPWRACSGCRSRPRGRRSPSSRRRSGPGRSRRAS